MKYQTILSPLLFMALALPACKAPDTLAAQQKACEGVRCTMDFKSVTVKIVDQQDNPVILESYAIILPGDKSVLRNGKDEGSNVYTIADDALVKAMPHGQGKYRFSGQTKDRRKVQATFIIGTNCCHVFLVSGPEKIVVP